NLERLGEEGSLRELGLIKEGASPLRGRNIIMSHHQHLHDTGPSWSQKLRRLAQESHQLMQAAEVDPIKVERLLRRIDVLRQELESMPHGPLLRWLENLRDEVEASTTCLDDSSFVGV